MNKRLALLFSLTGVAAIFLAACAVSPETTSEPPVEKTIYIGPELVDCTGVAPQKCMQVKESPEGEYTLFYDQIEGFEFEEGYEYTLTVREEKVENPPADAANFRWSLIEVVSKTAVSAPPAEASPLEGQIFSLDWYLSSSNEQVQVLPGTEITAEIAGGTISGSAGCNRYNASIQIDGEQIKIGQGMTTLMACPEPVMQQEQAYLEALQKVTSYQLADGVLTFMDAQGAVILSYSTLQPLPLTGTSWQMTGYNNGTGGFASAIAGSQIDALFGEDGSLSGSAGCNRYTSSYKLDGSNISISPAATTRMMCDQPEGVMEQETAYLQALERAATYAIEGDVLTLTDGEGTRVAEYKANPLIGTTWQLVEIQSMDDTLKTPDDPAKYTVKFLADWTLQFKADCNSGTGTYTLEEPTLLIELGAMTLVACEPESLSDDFIQQLGIAASYLFEGGDLFIATQMDSSIMRFTPAS